MRRIRPQFFVTIMILHYSSAINRKVSMRNRFNFFQSFSFFLSLFFIVAFIGCNKEPLYTPTSNSSTAIYDFWLEKTISNTTLNRAYQGMIMGDTTIRLVVDHGTDITALELSL